MAASKWHKITNITDADLAGSLDSRSGYVYNECNIDLASGSNADTEPFDFPVFGDLSVIVNTGAVNITDTYFGDVNQKIQMMGSVDGTNYAILGEVTNKTFDTIPYLYLYDYDAKGKCPYMKIRLIGTGTGTETIKVAVISQ